jgi:hypothetical protein
MSPGLTGDFSESDGDGEFGERPGRSLSDRFQRRSLGLRTRKRARRSRSNDLTRRGIHQRRKKRSNW